MTLMILRYISLNPVRLGFIPGSGNEARYGHGFVA